MSGAEPVEQYIRAAPAETRAVLRAVRAAIREAAPETEESTSYGIPFFSYRGEAGVDARLCYFKLQRASIGLYLRPKDLTPHSREIAEFVSTKSALRFRLDQPVPIPLIKRLVRDAYLRHWAEKASDQERRRPVRGRARVRRTRSQVGRPAPRGRLATLPGET